MLLNKIKHHNQLHANKIDLQLVEQAIDYILEYHKNQKRHSGEPFLIHLFDTQIAEEGGMALAKALEKNNSITSLDLGHNNLGDTVAKALAIFQDQFYQHKNCAVYYQKGRAYADAHGPYSQFSIRIEN